MVFSSKDPTGVAIQKVVAAIRAIIRPQNNPTINRHLELEIETLRKAPRDAASLQHLITKKELEKERSSDVAETQLIAAEIEMLKVVLYLVCRDL